MAKRAGLLRTVLFYVGVSLVALFMILPFVWMISTSLKESEAVMVLPIKWIPEKVSFKAYRDLFTISTMAPFHRAAFNSLVVSILTTFLNLASASMAAFALAKFDYSRNIRARGRCIFHLGHGLTSGPWRRSWPARVLYPVTQAIFTRFRCSSGKARSCLST